MSKKRKRHSPEQIVAKLRDADVMLNSGSAVSQDILDKLFEFSSSVE